MQADTQTQERKAGSAARKRAGYLFALGWVLIIANVLGIAWSIYFYFELLGRPQALGPYFFFDEQVAYALKGIIAVAAIFVVAVAQILTLDRIAMTLAVDTEESVAAESALRLAKYTAYFLAAACLVSFVLNTRTHRSWAEVLRNF